MTEVMRLLAFTVSSEFSSLSVICFAETPAQAKFDALGTETLSDYEYVELRAKRTPAADADAAKYGRGAIEFSQSEEQELAWRLGWYEADGEELHCDTCGRYQWSLVPKSRLDDDKVCADCRATGAT